MHFLVKSVLLVVILTQIAFAQKELSYYEIRLQAIDAYKRGQFKDAATLFMNALHQAETKRDDAAAAQCLIGLGNIYQNQGHFDEAQAAYKKSLSLLKHLPDSNLTVAIALHNLADSHIPLHQYRDALTTLNEASRIAAKVTAPHPELDGLIANDFGVVYFYQGKTGKAESFFLEALRVYSTHGDAFASDIAQSVNNLAELYRRRKRFQEAEQFYKRSIALTEQALGSSHPDLTVIFENLASLYADQKRYAEAEAYYRQSLTILEEGQSFLTARMIHTLHGLGKLYLVQGDRTKAVEVLGRAAEIIGPRPGWNPEIPAVLESYAKLLRNTGNSEQAEDLHSRAVRALAAMSLTVRAQDLH